MLKQHCFILLLTLITSSTLAQQFHKFKVTVGFGKTKSPSFPLAFVEPSYRICDNWSVGSRAEIASVPTDRVCHSFGVNSQFYLPKTTQFRPFIGLGFNFYSFVSTGSSAANSDYGVNSDKNKLGFCPRLGFDFDHLSMMLDYNLMTPFKVTSLNSFSPPVTSYFSGNYFSIKIGISIGGGKKK